MHWSEFTNTQNLSHLALELVKGRIFVAVEQEKRESQLKNVKNSVSNFGT
jgi:hypothetical protein